MAKCEIDKIQCPIDYTLSIVGGKWNWLIIYELSQYKVLRYGELKKILTNITHKMLSQQLKSLEAEGLVNRTEYHQIPPKVEYSLTDKAKTLVPILDLMYEWARQTRLVKRFILELENKWML